MAIWTPVDGYFGTLLSAIFGNATRRVIGKQDSGGGSSTGAGQSITPDAALRISAVWACVRLIAEAVGAMPINVYRIAKDGTRERIIDHWLHMLLNVSPNRYQTRNEFFETVVINLMIAGNSYNRKIVGTGGRVTSILSMSASQTEVRLLRDGDRSYIYTDGSDVAAFAQDNIWHVMLMPSNSVVGLSPIRYGARTIGIASAAEDRVATLAANGFKPTGVLMIDRLLKEDQRKQIRGQFSDLQTGQGDPLKVLEAGMKYQQISITPKDAQLLESRRFSVEEIARLFGVPSVLINDTAATTNWGSGIGEIKEGFYTLTLQPLLERLESSISKWLIPAADRASIIVEFDFSSFLRGSEANRVTTLTQAITGKLLTIDEARKRFDGLAPLPNNAGGVMYDQSQMIPIGTGNDNANPAGNSGN